MDSLANLLLQKQIQVLSGKSNSSVSWWVCLTGKPSIFFLCINIEKHSIKFQISVKSEKSYYCLRMKQKYKVLENVLVKEMGKMNAFLLVFFSFDSIYFTLWNDIFSCRLISFADIFNRQLSAKINFNFHTDLEFSFFISDMWVWVERCWITGHLIFLQNMNPLIYFWALQTSGSWRHPELPEGYITGFLL